MECKPFDGGTAYCVQPTSKLPPRTCLEDCDCLGTYFNSNGDSLLYCAASYDDIGSYQTDVYKYYYESCVEGECQKSDIRKVWTSEAQGTYFDHITDFDYDCLCSIAISVGNLCPQGGHYNVGPDGGPDDNYFVWLCYTPPFIKPNTRMRI